MFEVFRWCLRHHFSANSFGFKERPASLYATLKQQQIRIPKSGSKRFSKGLSQQRRA